MRMSMIDSTGYERFFGNILQSHDLLKKFPVYGDTPTSPMFTDDEIRAAIVAQGNDLVSPFLPPTHDQDGVGQCNADATTACAEYQRAVQGLPYKQLSAADLYHRINGGADNGSLLEDALEEMVLRGVGLASTCGTLWKRGMKLATAEERAGFQFFEVYQCPTFRHFASSIIAGFCGNSGILWYDNFDPDGDGWLPARGTGAPGGHSTMVYKVLMDRSSKLGLASLNSWGTRWGVLGGKMVIRQESYQTKEVGGWFAVRGIVDEGGVIPTPQA